MSRRPSYQLVWRRLKCRPVEGMNCQMPAARAVDRPECGPGGGGTSRVTSHAEARGFRGATQLEILHALEKLQQLGAILVAVEPGAIEGRQQLMHRLERREATLLRLLLDHIAAGRRWRAGAGAQSGTADQLHRQPERARLPFVRALPCTE